mmetsp:Transcript_143974/g.460169  ORF Transcript_143974/g.460169 Transcript_143974/m.460169 type:complete len:345 (+) Transcript_143974:1442-2476(+)
MVLSTGTLAGESRASVPSSGASAAAAEADAGKSSKLSACSSKRGSTGMNKVFGCSGALAGTLGSALSWKSFAKQLATFVAQPMKLPKCCAAASTSPFLLGVWHFECSRSMWKRGVKLWVSSCFTSQLMFTSKAVSGTKALGQTFEDVFSSTHPDLEVSRKRSASSCPTPRMATISYEKLHFQKNSSIVVTTLLVKLACTMPPKEASVTCFVGLSTSRFSVRSKSHFSWNTKRNDTALLSDHCSNVRSRSCVKSRNSIKQFVCEAAAVLVMPSASKYLSPYLWCASFANLGFRFISSTTRTRSRATLSLASNCCCAKDSAMSAVRQIGKQRMVNLGGIRPWVVSC